MCKTTNGREALVCDMEDLFILRDSIYEERNRAFCKCCEALAEKERQLGKEWAGIRRGTEKLRQAWDALEEREAVISAREDELDRAQEALAREEAALRSRTEKEVREPERIRRQDKRAKERSILFEDQAREAAGPAFPDIRVFGHAAGEERPGSKRQGDTSSGNPGRIPEADAARQPLADEGPDSRSAEEWSL